jgi:hypothetical protein
MTGSVSITGSLGVNGGLIGTSATFSGTITSSTGNDATCFQSTSATTGYNIIRLANSVSLMWLAVESNTAGTLVGQSLANAIILGNVSNAPLQFYTNAIVRQTITADGNVGIGTTSPGTTLHSLGANSGASVKGTSTYYGGGASSLYAVFGDVYGGGGAYDESNSNTWGGKSGGYFRGGNGGTYAGGGAGIHVLGGNASTSNAGGALATGGAGIFVQGGLNGDGTTYAYAGYFNGGNVVVMNGNVGIGTTTDAEFKLDVNGTGRFSGDITVSKSGDSGINLNSTTTNGTAVTRYQTTAAGSLWATGINITAATSLWEVYNFALGVSPLKISNSTGAATFSSTVTAIGGSIFNGFNGAAVYGVTINSNNDTGTQYMMDFQRQGNQAGYIASTSSTTVGIFNTSDYRMKEDLKSFSGIDKMMSMNFYDFKWKGGVRDYGVIAHELQGVLPNAVIGEKDAERMQAVDYVKLMPVVGKALQEALIRIEEQDIKIKTLENKLNVLLN